MLYNKKIVLLDEDN